MIVFIYLLSRGFCYFNSVAIAAKLLCMKMAVERVMIIDWVRVLFPVYTVSLQCEHHASGIDEGYGKEHLCFWTIFLHFI